MGTPILEDVQKGWKVFAGADEIGRVDEVDDDALTVSKGLLVRHTYRVPAEVVQGVDEEEGVFDLTVDRLTLEDLQQT